MWAGIAEIVDALWSMDAWSISSAVRHWSAYVLGAVVMMAGAFAVLGVFRLIPVLDRHLERSVLVLIYLTIAAIIFVEVIRRFFLGVQVPWSTTMPAYLFLLMTWIGCSYNTGLRAHLSFDEVRNRLPRSGQFACLTLDAVLWLGFSLIVIVTTARQTANAAANFQILLGTDNVLQWWFYAGVPISWLILSARVVENYLEDLHNLRTGQELTRKGAMLGDT